MYWPFNQKYCIFSSFWYIYIPYWLTHFVTICYVYSLQHRKSENYNNWAQYTIHRCSLKVYRTYRFFLIKHLQHMCRSLLWKWSINFLIIHSQNHYSKYPNRISKKKWNKFVLFGFFFFFFFQINTICVCFFTSFFLQICFIVLNWTSHLVIREQSHYNIALRHHRRSLFGCTDSRYLVCQSAMRENNTTITNVKPVYMKQWGKYGEPASMKLQQK